jgi:hypothetical protein
MDGATNLIRHIGNVREKGHLASVMVKIGTRKIKLVYDPGASHSVTPKKLWERIGLSPLTLVRALQAYIKVPIDTLGMCSVEMSAFSQKHIENLTVIDMDEVALFGLDLCIKFDLPLPEGVTIHRVTSRNPNGDSIDNMTKQLVSTYPEVFNSEPSLTKNCEVNIHLDDNAVPKAFPARSVPFSLCKAV